jgi:hypothetical protein
LALVIWRLAQADDWQILRSVRPNDEERVCVQPTDRREIMIAEKNQVSVSILIKHR